MPPARMIGAEGARYVRRGHGGNRTRVTRFAGESLSHSGTRPGREGGSWCAPSGLGTPTVRAGREGVQGRAGAATGPPHAVHEAGGAAVVVGPRSRARPALRQGPMSVAPLTLTTMAALEPRDTGVADEVLSRAVRPDGGRDRPRAGPSGPHRRDRLRGAAHRLRGDGRGDRHAGRGAGARRGVAVRVRVLRVLHDESVRDGVRRAAVRPAGTARGAGRRDRGLRGGAAALGERPAMWVFILGGPCRDSAAGW